MNSKQIVAITAIVWLVGFCVLFVLQIRRGRMLVSHLEREEPEFYQGHGRPRPGMFDSSRRRHFSRFMAKRNYLDLDDQKLAEEFERYRRSENRLLASALSGMAIVGGLMWWVSRDTE